MNSCDFIIFYVGDIPGSTSFYTELLGKKPVESSPGFSKFVLPTGFMFGLWVKTAVAPEVVGAPGASEIGIRVNSADEVKALYANWKLMDVKIIQEPMEMDFGYTFMAIDPDGHRIRVAYILN